MIYFHFEGRVYKTVRFNNVLIVGQRLWPTSGLPSYLKTYKLAVTEIPESDIEKFRPFTAKKAELVPQ